MDKIITIQSVEWPAAGKKQGKLTDVNDGKWYVYPDKLSSLKPGMTIKATDIATSQFQGRDYHTIKAFEIQGGASQGAGQAPAPNRAPSLPQTQSVDNDRRLDIFVCGAVNSILRNAAIDPMTFVGQQMVDVVNNLKKVWKMTLGPDAAKAPVARGETNDTFNDDIPF